MFIVLIGPWPVTDTPYADSDYAAITLDRAGAITPDPRSGPLRGGVAVVDMTPPPGVPMAGYSARHPKANTGVLNPIHAKALTLANGYGDVTIISGDYLLPLPALVDEVVRRTGLERHQIYFTASHTHSGPGGYAEGVFAESALGEFDRTQLDRMAAAFAKAVTESRATLVPVSIEVTQATLEDDLARRLVANQFTHGSGHATLNLLQMRDSHGASLATLVSFATHPTFLGTHNHKLSGDYPARVQEILQSRLQGQALFAAGAVGGNSPAPGSNEASDEVAQEIQHMNKMAELLSRVVMAVAEPNSTDPLATHVRITARWSGDAGVIDSHTLPVVLPAATYHISEGWRLSPFFVDWLFHGRDTEISALRLGNVLFLGYPADYSGELARDMEAWAQNNGKLAWITSFNGDYVGYVMPHERYLKPHYTTRDANVLGPWAGEYLNDIGRRVLGRLADASS